MTRCIPPQERTSCWSSQCKSALLFLSDGQPSEGFDENDENALREVNGRCHNCIRLFTYGLGSGIPVDVLQRLASSHGGTGGRFLLVSRA